MHNDPARFPEPEKFNVSTLISHDFEHPFDRFRQPDRYLGDNYSNAESANLADPTQRDHWMFGAGYVVIKLITHASVA